MKKFLLLAAAAALVVPGTATAARQSGIVVKVNRQSHVVAVAQKAGRVVSVKAPAARFARTAKPFKVGQRLSFAARRLRNGTVAGSAFRVTGRVTRVSVHGVVRAYNARKRTLALAAGGTVLRMKLARTSGRAFMATSPPPKVGAEVDVTASVDSDDNLEATDVTETDDTQGDDQQGENDDQQGQNDDQQADDQNDDQQADDQDDSNVDQSDSGDSSGSDGGGDGD